MMKIGRNLSLSVVHTVEYGTSLRCGVKIMKVYKTFKAKSYRHTSYLGELIIKDVNIELLESGITKETFDSNKHEHLIDANEVERMERLVGLHFVQDNLVAIVKDARKLSEDEVYGIQLITGLNATQFATLLGIHKGTLSKILKGRLEMKKPERILAMHLLQNEILTPGYCKALLGLEQPSFNEGRKRQIDVLLRSYYNQAS